MNQGQAEFQTEHPYSPRKSANFKMITASQEGKMKGSGTGQPANCTLQKYMLQAATSQYFCTVSLTKNLIIDNVLISTIFPLLMLKEIYE